MGSVPDPGGVEVGCAGTRLLKRSVRNRQRLRSGDTSDQERDRIRRRDRNQSAEFSDVRRDPRFRIGFGGIDPAMSGSQP